MPLRIQHLLLIAVLTVFFLILSFSLFGYKILGHKPEIEEIDPVSINPGDELVISGKYFGHKKKQSRVLVGGQSITSSAILDWSDSRITIAVPDFHRSTVLSVRTEKGESPGQIIINAEEKPQIHFSSFIPGFPFIEYIDPAFGPYGTVVSIYGQNFGYTRNNSTVLVCAVPDYSVDLFEEPDLKKMITIYEGDYIYWSDSLIKFVIPDKSVTGPVYVKTSAGYSNPLYYELDTGPVEIVIEGSISYKLRQCFFIYNTAGFPDNSLKIWAPSPMEYQLQYPVSLDETSHSSEISRDNGDLIVIDNILSGETVQIMRDFSVERYACRYKLNISELPAKYNMEKDSYKEYVQPLSGDSSVNKRIASIASSVSGGEYHPYYKAYEIYQYVLKLLTYDGQSPGLSLPEILDRKIGGSREYVFLFCALARSQGIPARPVAGIVIPDGPVPCEAVSHWWAEFYLEGGGWIPLDPAMADGAGLISCPEGVSKQDYWWCALDSSRTAFSRGLLNTPLMQPLGRTSGKEQYSYQNIYEEADGLLASYRSDWKNIIVLDKQISQ